MFPTKLLNTKNDIIESRVKSVDILLSHGKLTSKAHVDSSYYIKMGSKKASMREPKSSLG